MSKEEITARIKELEDEIKRLKKELKKEFSAETRKKLSMSALKRFEHKVLIGNKVYTTHELSEMTGIAIGYLNQQIKKNGYFVYKKCHYNVTML